mgnify:CR=1 FL=1|tara:strand:+ start:212 stop:1312 length:1101 start_codon:yes stop_codon:yes gene_type:complete
MAIQTGLESLANLQATRASTEQTKQQTFEMKETFGTRKRAAELTLEQSEYQFDELKANRPTRDALNALQVTTAQQMHQHLIDNPHYFSAKMQVELDAKKWELEDKQLARIYDMQFARGQEIQRALESGDSDAIERANFHLQALREEYQSTTGEPFDIGIDMDSGEFQGLTLQHLPFIREMNRVAAHMGPYAREREALFAENQLSESDILGNVKDTLDIQNTQRANAGNAIIAATGNLGAGITITSQGHVQVAEGHENKRSEAQLQKLVAAIQKITPLGGYASDVAGNMGDMWQVESDSQGVMGSNFNYIHPVGELAKGMGFDKELFEQAVIDYAEQNGVTNQAAADTLVAENIDTFVNMVTSTEQK